MFTFAHLLMFACIIFTTAHAKGNGQKPAVRGAHCSLFSKAGIAAPASCRSYCILIYSQTNYSRQLFPATELHTVPEH